MVGEFQTWTAPIEPIKFGLDDDLGRVSVSFHRVAKYCPRLGSVEGFVAVVGVVSLCADVASSFYDLKTAELAISEIMRNNSLRIRSWSRSRPSYHLVLNGSAGRDIGYGVVRGTGGINSATWNPVGIEA